MQRTRSRPKLQCAHRSVSHFTDAHTPLGHRARADKTRTPHFFTFRQSLWAADPIFYACLLQPRIFQKQGHIYVTEPKTLKGKKKKEK